MMNNSLHLLINEYLELDEITDEENMFLLKKKILKTLTPLEQQILLLYADEGSYRKVAKLVNCSQTQVMNIIKKIRQNLTTNGK